MPMMMSRAFHAWGMGVLIIGLVACSSVSIPPPAHQDAHIGISLSSRVLFFKQDLTNLYFAKLEEQQRDFIPKGALIASNVRVGDRFYLLNAPPGRYVVVAARGVSSHWTTSSSGQMVNTGETPYYIAFSKPLIALTEANGEPGRLTFIGSFRVKTRANSIAPAPDEVQNHTTGTFHALPYLGSVDEVEQGAESRQAFLAKARDDLGPSVWGAIIQKSLAVPE